MLIRTLLAAALALSSVAASAQTTAAGPYYATPSWDQTMPAATRFVVLTNFNSEAVLDRETGLVWQQNPAVLSESWNAATNYAGACPAAVTGGRSGWRLPRLDEIQTLNTGIFTGLPAGHPFGANAHGTFWTANTTDSTHAVGWGIASADGESVGVFLKTYALNSWCVRGPSSGFAGS